MQKVHNRLIEKREQANNRPGRVVIIFSFSGPVFSHKEQAPGTSTFRISNPTGFFKGVHDALIIK